MFSTRTSDHNISSNKIDSKRKLENQLRLYHVDSIVSNDAVVPEFNYDGGLQPTEDYLVIQNRIQWLDYFYQFNSSNGTKLYPQLYTAYSYADEDKALTMMSPIVTMTQKLNRKNTHSV